MSDTSPSDISQPYSSFISRAISLVLNPNPYSPIILPSISEMSF